MEVRLTSGVEFQDRPTAGAAAVQQSSTSGLAAPYWVRLVRQGSTFTAYRSSNGTTWTQQGSPITITMGTSVFVGLAVCSHDNTQLNTSTFDNVTVSQPTLAT